MKTDGSSRYDDLAFAELTEHALALGEGQLSKKGALAVSAKRNTSVQRFIVKEPSVTDVLRADAQLHLLDTDLFRSIWAHVKDDIVERSRYRIHAHMGIDPSIAVPLQINTLKAWHGMSCHHLCHIPDEYNPRKKPEWKLIWAPIRSFGDVKILNKDSGVVMIHVGKRRILMGGDLSTGELRRTLLTLLGLLLPEKHSLPLHGAASHGDCGITLFLGPAGTQKTTWALRCGQLIGDRALSWSQEGLHRLADGCRLHLDQNLPISLDTALQFGTIAENFALSSDRSTFKKNNSNHPAHLVLPLVRLRATLKSDTRGPSQLVILTTDPLGVLPALSTISQEQCLAWFILGYGNHLGPLKEHLTEVDIRFTPGFLDSLLPRNIDDYVLILEDLLKGHGTRCFLINAGWHNGPIGLGNSLSASEEDTVMAAMHHCTDWESFKSLGLFIPKGRSETAESWHNSQAYADNLSQLILSITNELKRTKDPERWLRALEIK